MERANHSHRQRGATLLETLIAITIFAIGTLAMLAMYGRAVGTVADTQQRTDAAAYASDLLQELWLRIERDSTGLVIPTSLTRFAYAEGGANCGQFAGAAAEATVVTPWVNRLKIGAGRLPGATDAGMAQIRIEPLASNRVTITVCWRNPVDGLHRHETVAYIN